MKLGTPVEVTWADATSVTAWATLDEHQAVEPRVVKSAGYLSRADKSSVQIVQSVQQDPDGLVGDSLTIPRGWVKRIRRLR